MGRPESFSRSMSNKLTSRKSTVAKELEVGVCRTFEDCLALKAPSLSLAGDELDHYPNGLTQLTHLRDLILDNNKIADVPVGTTPKSLERISMVGNELTSIPTALLALPNLKHICLGANYIKDASPAFRCPRLLHIGLGYNRVTRLSDLGPGWYGKHNVMSLDLSNNDLCNLSGTISCLAMLPNLAILSLRGNPLALQLEYRSSCIKALPKLVLLDGCQIESVSGAGGVAQVKPQRPGKRLSLPVTPRKSGLPTTPSRFEKFASTASAMIQDDDAVQTGVRLSCEALQPAQDYASRAPPGCSHGEVWVEVVNRLAGDEALMLPRVTVPVEGGGEDAAGDGEAEEAAGKAQWEAMTPVTVPLRDVIRSGVKVVLWEQWHAAPAPEGGKDAAANAGEDGEGGEGTTPVAPPEEALKPRAVGHSWCAFPALLDAGSGGSLQSSCTVHLKPYARIFDENGLRMAVDDPRHKEEAIASVSMTMEVHVDPEVIAERMEKMDSVEEGEE